LIFSDAGAARRDYIPRRINATELFINRLKQQVKTIVWLNPLPESAWQETTAAEIAKLKNIKMFPADSAGFKQAIDIMSGQLPIISNPGLLPPLLSLRAKRSNRIDSDSRQRSHKGDD
jgi:hypothetical protein